MKPYYQEEAVTIYHGDCREILPELPDRSVGLVLTDPPYNLIGLDNFIDLATYRKWARIWYAESFRCLKRKGNFILSGRSPVLSHLIVDICEYGKVFREMVTWHKTDGITHVKDYHSTNYEQFAIFSDWLERTFNYIPVESKTNNYSAKRNAGSIWEYPKLSRHHKEGKKHPEQKPIAIIKRLIETYSDVGEAILDPFLGSGTTAYCAKKLGRKAIGIEIEEKYCEIAANRCQQTVMEL